MRALKPIVWVLASAKTNALLLTFILLVCQHRATIPLLRVVVVVGVSSTQRTRHPSSSSSLHRTGRALVHILLKTGGLLLALQLVVLLQEREQQAHIRHPKQGIHPLRYGRKSVGLHLLSGTCAGCSVQLSLCSQFNTRTGGRYLPTTVLLTTFCCWCFHRADIHLRSKRSSSTHTLPLNSSRVGCTVVVRTHPRNSSSSSRTRIHLRSSSRVEAATLLLSTLLLR